MKWVLLAVLLLAGVVVAVHIIKVRPTPSSPASSDEIRVNSLVRLDCYPFEVRYSENAREQAVRLAELAKDAYAYFAVVFPGSSRTFTSLFLTPDDWKRGYAMPSCKPG